jgi:hypothetical protein
MKFKAEISAPFRGRVNIQVEGQTIGLNSTGGVYLGKLRPADRRELVAFTIAMLDACSSAELAEQPTFIKLARRVLQLAAPVGAKPIGQAAYEALSPRDQGYASYMQDSWNPWVPSENPFAGKDDQSAKEWDRGQREAVGDVQDMEE